MNTSSLTESPAELLRDDGTFTLHREAGIKTQARIILTWTATNGQPIHLAQVFTSDLTSRRNAFAVTLGPDGERILSSYPQVVSVLYEVWAMRRELAAERVQILIERRQQRERASQERNQANEGSL